MRGLRSETLAKWIVLLAAPTIWFAHLMIVYGIVSLEVTWRGFAGLPSATATVVVTLASLAAIFWIGRAVWLSILPRWASPQQDLMGLWRTTGAGLALLSFFGVLWQALPPLAVPGAPGSHYGNSSLGVIEEPENTD